MDIWIEGPDPIHGWFCQQDRLTGGDGDFGQEVRVVSFL